MDLALAIVVTRTEAGMSRADLAKAADVSYPYISEIEVGTKTPSVAVLCEIAIALDIPLSSLILKAENY